MLQIEIPDTEYFEEDTSTFIFVKKQSLSLEHSLVSLAKWESKWCKPFLHSKKTLNEIIDYVRCMTITQNVNPIVYKALSEENIEKISSYINAPMTATWFNDRRKAGNNKEIVTAEIIYYWMISYGIPMECQKWHLNRLITLIRVCDDKNSPKKMGKNETLRMYSKINAERCAKLNTKG